MAVTQLPSPHRKEDSPVPTDLESLIPGLVLVGVGTLAALAVHQLFGGISTLLAAVVIGAILGNSNVASPDTAAGVSFAAKTILRVGVVLLGLRLSIDQVTSLGIQTVGIVVGTTGFTFFFVQWLGRRMGLSPSLSLLVGTGFSICGLSAIAAVEGSSDAEEEEVAAAMGLVTLFGTLAIFVIPALGAMFGLADQQLGTWIGASVHDTAQVVAAASARGPEVLAIAIAVKLTRVLLLAPIVAGVNLNRTRTNPLSDGARPALVPTFVIGFIGMILVRTSGVLSEQWLSTGKALEGFALAAAMVGLGANVKIQRLRSLGPRPLLLGVLAWVVVASVSLGAIVVLG